MSGSRQLELFVDRPVTDRAGLHDYLAANLPHPLTLSLTRNRVSMVEYRQHPDGSIALRLHEHFLQAPMPILAALRRYLRSHRKTDWREVSLYVQTLNPTLAPKRSLCLSPKGKVYDLDKVRDRINGTYFEGRIDCTIGWGTHRRSRGKQRRSIRYGSCDVPNRTIRLHPLLDQAKVPARFVDYVVFHEMLHLAIPPRRNGRIWQQHPPEFRQAERRFPGHREMRRLADALLVSIDN